MPTFEDVQPLLDKFFPRGAKREIWWVTKESLKNTCNRCGRCCAMVGFDMGVVWHLEDGKRSRGIGFVSESMVRIPPDEAEARGTGPFSDNFFVCSKLTEDGLCSINDNKPDFCARHPILGQSVLKECAFAGIDDYDKSPRGIEAAEMANRPADKIEITVDKKEDV